VVDAAAAVADAAVRAAAVLRRLVRPVAAARLRPQRSSVVAAEAAAVDRAESGSVRIRIRVT